MLAQQGKLAELVQQHLQLKKQPTVAVNRVRLVNNSTLCNTGVKSQRAGRSEARTVNPPVGIIYFTPVFYIEVYSRLNCGHFVDLEKWDYMRQCF